MCNVAIAGTVAKNADPENASFDTSSFDDKQDKLPPYYKGHSIDMFQETVFRNEVFSKGKTEFETSSAFEERKRVTINSMKFGKMNVSSKWAFMYNPDDTLTYDPELSQFSFPITIDGDEPSIVIGKEKESCWELYRPKCNGCKSKSN